MNYEASRSSRAHALVHPHHSVSGPLLPARIRDHIVAVLLVERNDVRLGGEEDVRVPMARRFCLDSPEDEGAEAPVLQRRVDQVEREEDARGGAGPRDLHYLWTRSASRTARREALPNTRGVPARRSSASLLIGCCKHTNEPTKRERERECVCVCVVALVRGEVCAGTLARRTPPNWDGASLDSALGKSFTNKTNSLSLSL